MRPPEFTGGNFCPHPSILLPGTGFNEAAGIHRRKPQNQANRSGAASRFNEAAGIHRRKPVRIDPLSNLLSMRLQ